MIKAMVANVRVEHTDNTITVRTQDFGTLADFATIVEAEAQESKARTADREKANGKAPESKAPATARKDSKDSVKR